MALIVLAALAEHDRLALTLDEELVCSMRVEPSLRSS